MDEPICQYKHCGRPIVVTPGHRPRAYCDDRCKVAAFRMRQEQAERERHMAEVRAQFGGYSDATLHLLDSIMQYSGIELAQRVALAINAEVGSHKPKGAKATNRDVQELEQARADLRRLYQSQAREQEEIHRLYVLAQDLQTSLGAARNRIAELELSEQNLRECQEKLSQAGQHIIKLEQQVATQKQRLAQSYQQGQPLQPGELR